MESGIRTATVGIAKYADSSIMQTVAFLTTARTAARKWTERSRQKMTPEEAIKLLESEYERAKRLDFVINPIAYALYQVWKKADRRKKRMPKNDR